MNGRRRRRRSWRRRLPLLVIYLGPLTLWMAVLFAASTRFGRYEVSARVVEKALSLLAGPESSDITLLAHYSLNVAVRRLAHVFGYFVLSLLIVRAVQWGTPRLRWRSLAAAFFINTAVALGEMLHRNRTPQRHGDLSDLALNLTGGALALLTTIVFFAGKRWEQKALEAARAETGAPEEEAAQQKPPPLA